MSNLYALSDEELQTADLESLATTEPVDTPQAEQEPTDELTDTQTSDDSENTQQEDVDTDTSSSEESSDEVEPVAVNHEEFYQKLTKPFRANGREIQIDNADDAIRLMQMGANYSKKMEQLKPKQALLKVLSDNGLDNQDELGFLLDLKNKKPEAIAKLLKESEIDLYDFDTEQANEYKPNLAIAEITPFEDTLNEVLVDNPQMREVISDMSNWDNASKDVLFNEPNILRVLSEQKANGIYDRIIATVEKERMLGRMTDMNFLQAYSAVEAKLLEQQTKQQGFIAPRPTQTPSDNTDAKKRTGMVNNTASTKATIDLYKLTDEELNKLIANGEI